MHTIKVVHMLTTSAQFQICIKYTPTVVYLITNFSYNKRDIFMLMLFISMLNLQITN
jgi:hypothetical protein